MNGVETRFTRYRPLAIREVRGWFIPGADVDDVRQEAMIGLWRAACDFEPHAGVPFAAFARLCIKRQLSTAVLAANRGKQQPLNRSRRFAWPDEDTGPWDIEDRRASVEPLSGAIMRETARQLEAVVWSMPEMEREALLLTASGWSYAEIARFWGAHEKRVDNALQRARRKVAAELGLREAA